MIRMIKANGIRKGNTSGLLISAVLLSILACIFSGCNFSASYPSDMQLTAQTMMSIENSIEFVQSSSLLETETNEIQSIPHENEETARKQILLYTEKDRSTLAELEQGYYHYRGKSAYYNKLSDFSPALPVKDLDIILQEYGMDSNAECGVLQCDGGQYFYSIDLTMLTPVFWTTDYQLVCELNGAGGNVIAIIETSPNPGMIRYYIRSSWDAIAVEKLYYLDGVCLSGDKAELCEQVFSIHANGKGYQRLAIADGDVSIHVLSVSFLDCPGLTEHIYLFDYMDFPSMIYSKKDGYYVAIPIDIRNLFE